MLRYLALALAATTLSAGPALAGRDYSTIPAAVRDQIKAKCMADHPGDYTSQNGCIIIASESYLDVRGYAAEPPSALSRADAEMEMEVAGLYQVLHEICGEQRSPAKSVAEMKAGALAALKRDGEKIFANAVRASRANAKRLGKAAFCNPDAQLVAE